MFPIYFWGSRFFPLQYLHFAQIYMLCRHRLKTKVWPESPFAPPLIKLVADNHRIQSKDPEFILQSGLIWNYQNWSETTSTNIHAPLTMYSPSFFFSLGRGGWFQTSHQTASAVVSRHPVHIKLISLANLICQLLCPQTKSVSVHMRPALHQIWEIQTQAEHVLMSNFFVVL